MRRNLIVVLSAVTAVAALGVSGCSGDLARPAADPAVGPPAPPAPPVEPGPLPPPQDLSDTMSRLADPAIPGVGKLNLVQGAATPDAAALDRFAGALRDTGFTPVTVSASEIRWSDNHPGDVLATIKVVGPAGVGNGEFSFPMEFRRAATGWQLTRDTAEQLLAFGNAHPDAQPSATGPTPPS